MSCLQTRYGAGQHVWNVPLSSLKPGLQLAYGTLLVYNLALSLTKISVCLFYLRVFGSSSSSASRTNRLLCIACIGFVVAYTIPLEVVSIVQCRPPDAVWNTAPGESAQCIDTIPAFYTSAACNMAVDLWLIAYAVPRVLPLPLPRRQKVVLLFFVSLGWMYVVWSNGFFFWTELTCLQGHCC